MRANAAVQQSVEREAAPIRKDEPRIGVVFVHGIGQQAESDAIREFGGHVLRWLREWHEARGLAIEVERSVLSYGDRGEPPARFSVRILAHGGPAQTWVFAEAWWAARLRAPSFPRMVGWGWIVVTRVLQRLADSAERNVTGSTRQHRSALERVIRFVSALFLFIGYAAVMIVSLPLILVLFVLAQLPGPFERLVLGIRLFVVEQIGDFYTFLHDDVQALHIRSAVAYAIDYLVTKEECERIVVMAHSQGSVVAFDALSSEKIAHIGAVSTLVTVGGALNNAFLLKSKRSTRLERELPPHIRWLDVWSDYDPVSGGRLVRRGHPVRWEDLHVLNELNVITDHGGYFTNREEFLSRLAQEIDSPADHTRSRFYPGTDVFEGWRDRRRDRILAMVAWRLAAFFLFGYAMWRRLQPVDRLGADGEAAWLWLGRLPVVGGVIDAVTGLARWLSLGPPATDVLARFAGIAVWGIAYTLLFLVLYVLVFTPWHEAEGRRSVGPDAPPRGGQAVAIAVASAVVLFGLVAGAIAIAEVAPLPRP